MYCDHTVLWIAILLISKVSDQLIDRGELYEKAAWSVRGLYVKPGEPA